MNYITKRKAIQNYMNACLGYGILAQPYFVGITGWYSVITVLLTLCLSSYVAICFANVTLRAMQIHSLDSTSIAANNSPDAMENSNVIELTQVNDNKTQIHTEKSAHEETKQSSLSMNEISKLSLGSCGQLYGVAAFLGTMTLINIILLVQSFELLKQIIASFVKQNYVPDDYGLFFCIAILMLCTCFALNWSQMTWISVLSNISAFMVLIIIIYVYILFQFSQFSVQEESNQPSDTVNVIQYVDNMSVLQLFCFGFLGLFQSVVGHATVPSLMNSLQNKKDIYSVIIVSYLCVMSMYVLCGTLGYLVYHEYTHVMILNNLFYWPGDWVVTLVSCTIIINLVGSYGIYSTIFCEIIEAISGTTQQQTWKRRSMRIVYLIIIAVIAYFGRYYLAFWFAMVGIYATAFGPGIMLIILFYIGLFWNDASLVNRSAHIMLLVVSILMGVITVYSSITGLV